MTTRSASRTTRGGEGSRALTAEVLAQWIGGVVRGDGSVIIEGVAPLDRAQQNELSFLASASYGALFRETRAGAVLVSPELADAPGATPCRIVVAQPYEAMLGVLPRLYPETPAAPCVHPSALVGRDVRIGERVSIGPFAVIGDRVAIGDDVVIGAQCVVGDGVEIGDGTQFFPSVTMYPGTRVGRRVRVHAGARLGCDGFGYVFRDGAHQKMPHVGRCIIGDDVEIGANTTIDRGSIDDTVIGAGTKIDNLVHIAHNVRIGRGCLIMAQVGIAGSVHVGDGCILAGQVGISGHHTIGDRVTLAAQAGVFGDIPAGETWSGYPARPHREALRAHAALFKLASLLKRIERLLDERAS